MVLIVVVNPRHNPEKSGRTFIPGQVPLVLANSRKQFKSPARLSRTIGLCFKDNGAIEDWADGDDPVFVRSARIGMQFDGAAPLVMPFLIEIDKKVQPAMPLTLLSHFVSPSWCEHWAKMTCLQLQFDRPTHIGKRSTTESEYSLRPKPPATGASSG
jgi:hypothetical protein